METTGNSFIEQQLSQVQSSISSQSEFMSFLQGLKVVVLEYNFIYVDSFTHCLLVSLTVPLAGSTT